MKKILLLLLILSLFSCTKKNKAEESLELGKDIVYTNSFAPEDWENPTIRKNVITGDKDIGNYIREDVVDPKLRNLLVLVKNFVGYLKSGNQIELEKIMTASSYNSYLVRFAEIRFTKNVIIRVQQPEDLSPSLFWIQFKLMFNGESVIGKIQVQLEGESYKVSDFENKLFEDIKKKLAGDIQDATTDQ